MQEMSDDQATTVLTQTEAPKTETTPSPTTPTTPAPDAIAKPASTEPAKTESKPTLLNDKSLVQSAPEKYEDFKVPEGFEFDKEKLAEATTVFKELNISQEGAQKLMDMYSKASIEAAEAGMNLWKQTQEDWIAEIKADDKLGHKLPEVRSTVSKMIDQLPKEIGAGFREAMDFTGAGNNPAFIRALYALAQLTTEGTKVAGKGPSPLGQSDGSKPRSGAAALYPNLPSGA